jgi:ferredoxin-NADP reductase
MSVFAPSAHAGWLRHPPCDLRRAAAEHRLCAQGARRSRRRALAAADATGCACGDIAYLCGNPDMVDATFEALKDIGLPIPMIRREKYASNQ